MPTLSTPTRPIPSRSNSSNSRRFSHVSPSLSKFRVQKPKLLRSGHLRTESLPVTKKEKRLSYIVPPIDRDANMVNPPSQLEQERYYCGLPSQPKLIARSSTEPWRNFERPIPKMLGPVVKHKIVSLWNDSNGPLRQDMLAAVASLNWTALDILRIGYDDIFTNTSIEHPVTLFISVEKDSTSWPVGHSIVQRCRRILRYYDMDDVHVNVKESRITLLMPDTPVATTSAVPPAPTAPLIIPKLTAAALGTPVEFHGIFSEYLGSSIASSDLMAEGTKCLYLRHIGNDKILALTCRHIALPGEKRDVDYRHDETTVGRAILQPGDRFINEKKDSIAATLAGLDETIERLRNNSTLVPEVRRNFLRRPNQDKVTQQQNLRALEQLKDPATRVIGHVLFAPAFGMGTTKRGAERLRDWALIELHQEKHSTDLNMLQNRVIISEWLKSSLDKVVRAEFGTSKYHMLLFDDSNTVPLLDTIPEREIYDSRLQQECKTLDAEAMMVLKYGRSTGLTVGLANQVKSVVRFPHEDDPAGELSEEWCIVGYRKLADHSASEFSKPGDSGACIWDIHGRIGGMITAGLKNELKSELDITYATTIEWLLEDIKKHGFNVELLGSWAWE